MRPRFGMRAAIGVAGDALVEDQDVDFDDDLEATVGFALEYEHPFARWYSLGFETGLNFWRTDLAGDRDVDRNILLDVMAVQRLRIGFGKRKSHGAFYLAVPFGATVSIARDGWAQEALGMMGISLGPGGGMIVGGRLGFQVFFGPHFGITAEGGYHWRLIRHRVDESPTADSAQIRFGQGVVQAGIVLAF